MKIKDLIEKRAKVWEAAKNFVDTHENENGVLSAEDSAIRAIEIAGAIFLYLNVTVWIRSVFSAKVPVLGSDLPTALTGIRYLVGCCAILLAQLCQRRGITVPIWWHKCDNGMAQVLLH